MPTIKLDAGQVEDLRFLGDQIGERLDGAAVAVAAHSAGTQVAAARFREGAADIRHAGHEVLIGMLALAAALVLVVLTSRGPR